MIPKKCSCNSLAELYNQGNLPDVWVLKKHIDKLVRGLLQLNVLVIQPWRSNQIAVLLCFPPDRSMLCPTISWLELFKAPPFFHLKDLRSKLPKSYCLAASKLSWLGINNKTAVGLDMHCKLAIISQAFPLCLGWDTLEVLERPHCKKCTTYFQQLWIWCGILLFSVVLPRHG